jgi:hypothetical protein
MPSKESFAAAVRGGCISAVREMLDADADAAHLRGPLDEAGNDALALAVGTRSPGMVSLLCARGFVPRGGRSCALMSVLRIPSRHTSAVYVQMLADLLVASASTDAFRTDASFRKRIFKESAQYNVVLLTWLASTHGLMLEWIQCLEEDQKFELMSVSLRHAAQAGFVFDADTALSFLRSSRSSFGSSIVLEHWAGEIRDRAAVSRMLQLVVRAYSQLLMGHITNAGRVVKQWWVIRECILRGYHALAIRLPRETRIARNSKGQCAIMWAIGKGDEKHITFCLDVGLVALTHDRAIVERSVVESALCNPAVSEDCCRRIVSCFQVESWHVMSRWRFGLESCSHRDDFVRRHASYSRIRDAALSIAASAIEAAAETSAEMAVHAPATPVAHASSSLA